MSEIEICTLNGTKWILGDESPEPMTWVDAKAWCESIGQELPPRDVLLMAYLNPETRSEFANNYYWSSSEFSSSLAWGQYFNDGYQGTYDNLYITLPVRAVRAINMEELLDQLEQEPDLWVVTNSIGINKYLYSRPRKQVREAYKITEYYKQLPKSKPLIEKAHGIGVDNNGN